MIRLWNVEWYKKSVKVEKSENAAEVHYEKQKNRNIICLTYEQGKVFEKFKEKIKFSSIWLPFSV